MVGQISSVFNDTKDYFSLRLGCSNDIRDHLEIYFRSFQQTEQNYLRFIPENTEMLWQHHISPSFEGFMNKSKGEIGVYENLREFCGK